MQFYSKKNLLFILIKLCIYGNSLFAQNENKHDSITSPNYKAVFETNLIDFVQENPKWIEQDTTFSLFSEFDAVQNQPYCFSSLGNIGSSHRMLEYQSNTFGFRFKDIPLTQYLITKNNITIFKPSSPYTRLYYVTGSGKQHVIGGNHAQQIKNFLIGLNFGVINSLGIYQHQKTNLSNASVFVNYNNKKHYGATLIYFFNKATLQENGGLAIDSLFDNNIEPYRAGMPVRFEKAQNKYVDNNLFFTQFYRFSKSKDSISFFFDLGSIVHSLDLSKGKWIYSDEIVDSTTFDVFYRDSLTTLDSLGFLKLSNSLEWRNGFNFTIGNKNRKLLTYWCLTHEFIDAGDYKVRHFYNNILLNASTILKWDSSLYINYGIKYILAGYGKNGYEQILNFSYKLQKSHIFNLQFTDQINPQSFFTRSYHSNYYDWQNNFNPTHESKIALSYSNKFVELGIEGISVDNYVFLNKFSLPEAYDEKMNIYSAWSVLSLKWRVLNSQTKLTYHASNADSILMYPNFTVRERLSFVFPMFHNAMIANAGFDVFYTPIFKAAYYNPSMFGFYLNTDKEIGNYIYIDVFLGFKVKRFNFFVKLINAPKGFLPYNYYSTPSYPLPDRQFKIGFSWRFYD